MQILLPTSLHFTSPSSWIGKDVKIQRFEEAGYGMVDYYVYVYIYIYRGV